VSILKNAKSNEPLVTIPKVFPTNEHLRMGVTQTADFRPSFGAND
jgi:hypothetical protein